MTALASFHPDFQWATLHRRAKLVAPLPDAVQAALQGEAGALDRTDYKAANQLVGTTVAQLKRAKVHKAFDEQAIRDHAENYSRLAGRILTLEARAEFARGCGVDPPEGKTITRDGALQRLADPLWWRRQLRKVWTRAAENSMRDIGMIRKGRAPYASDDAVRHRAAQKRRARDFLEQHDLVNEVGEQLPLLAVAERSLANPALRRGEFMTRLRGFNEIAEQYGHTAEFVTLTAPSAFHAQLANGGANPAYRKSTVRDAQRWLCGVWARARASLHRLSILVYGFRIAEPHHDGTPHWHMVLFFMAGSRDRVRFVLKNTALSDYGWEPGAAEHRAKFVTIDPQRGSAVGYIAKYVSKNIDGVGSIGNERSDEAGGSVFDSIRRVDAWASIHGIRQFQQIGGPPVGLWREARRLRDPVADTDIERARRCADRGDWRGFTQRVGGITAGRRTNMRIERCERGTVNRYGENRPPEVIGLRWASAVVITRPHSWRIERRPGSSRGSGHPLKPNAPCTAESGVVGKRRSESGSGSFPLGPVAITVRGASGAGEPSGWANPQETSQAGPQ